MRFILSSGVLSLNADIPRVARAAVFRQTDDAQARITDFRHHPRRVIGRRVIDDDALDIPFRLIEDALDRFSDSISSIIRWQHHRNHDSHPRCTIWLCHYGS